jgi:aquaporin Z
MHRPSLHRAATVNMRISTAPRSLFVGYLTSIQALDRPLFSVVKRNWPLYMYEAIELALFMISACAFSLLLFDSSSPAFRAFPSTVVRRILMAIAMGITAVLIIHSPMGKRSGAHFNPVITLTYLRLGKIGLCDAVFYVAFQFIGGILGVAAAASAFGKSLSKPTIDYAITVPGRYGIVAAFFAELFMATVLMAVVLLLSNTARLAIYVSYSVGILIALYTFFFAQISGFSINPARTTGSALFAGVWTAGWLYFVAPLLGMFSAAEIYTRLSVNASVLCAKLHPDPALPCPFFCSFPGHRHLRDPHAFDAEPVVVKMPMGSPSGDQLGEHSRGEEFRR